MNIGVITRKLATKKGGIFCATKISGVNNDDLQLGDKFVGELAEDLDLNQNLVLKPVNGANGLTTTKVLHIVRSFNSVLIRTKNSIYLLEAIPE